MPKLDFFPYDGRIPKGDDLKKKVDILLLGPRPSDHVIALTDVYTGTRDFADAADAKTKMRGWVGEEPRFHPHAAQYDFEAWLLPYWSVIKRLAGTSRGAPGMNPELVNHNNPPARLLKEIFEAGKCRNSYVKPRDARRILQGQSLAISIEQCAELKAFVNTILGACGAEAIP